MNDDDLLALHSLLESYFAYQNKDVYPDQKSFGIIKKQIKELMEDLKID